MFMHFYVFLNNHVTGECGILFSGRFRGGARGLYSLQPQGIQNTPCIDIKTH